MFQAQNGQRFSLTNTIFENNTIQGHHVEIEQTEMLLFKKIDSFFLNFNSDNEISKVGVCFRTIDVLRRDIDSLNINNCFSGRTTVGLKIIDNKENIEKMTQLSKTTSLQIVNFFFFKNFY